MIDLPIDLRELISIDADGLVESRENKRLEYKQDFDAADFSTYTKTLAAFANAEGGTVIFGVANKPRRVVGTAEPIDEARWSDRIREDFEPEINFAIREYVVSGFRLFAVGVDAAVNKPVICKKGRSKIVLKKGVQEDVEVIREGAIYYRYAGQSKTIKFSELNALLVTREQRLLKQMLETLQVIQKVGLDKTGILDMSAPTSSVIMTEETAKRLAFIDKGTLVKKKGAPAYVVLGSVDVGNVVHAPLDEADKNLPTEAAKALLQTVRALYGNNVKIHASQVTALLRHLGIEGDNQHCVVEKKLCRKYVTRAGINALAEFMKSDPLKALKVFGSRATIADYESARKEEAGAVEE